MITYDDNALQPSNDTQRMDAVPSSWDYYTYKNSISSLVARDTYREELRVLSLRGIEYFGREHLWQWPCGSSSPFPNYCGNALQVLS